MGVKRKSTKEKVLEEPVDKFLTGEESNKMSYVYAILSNIDGANSPSPTGTDYQILFYPPQSDVGADPSMNGLVFGMDMLNFEPSDDANGDLTLEKIKIQSFSPTLLP